MSRFVLVLLAAVCVSLSQALVLTAPSMRARGAISAYGRSRAAFMQEEASTQEAAVDAEPAAPPAKVSKMSPEKQAKYEESKKIRSIINIVLPTAFTAFLIYANVGGKLPGQ